MAATLALACGLGGRRTESEAIVAELDRRSRSQYICPVPMALGYAGLGDKETAFHLMGQALEERCPLVLWFTWPIFDILREDVRFQAVLDRIGLSRA